MGVKDLWQLLGPIGRRISIETLEGKILAIDMSIWLTQFIKAMRDDDGNMIKNAHLLGTLRRILKLMYHKIKPIFIFDGATPELKLRTIKLRRKILEKNEESRRSTIHKLLLAQIKAQLKSSLQIEATKQADKNLESNVLSTFNLPQKQVSTLEEESQKDSNQGESSQQADSPTHNQPSSSINLLIEDENDVEWESGPIPNKPQRKKLLSDESSEGEPSSESEGDEDDPRYSLPEDYEDLNVDVLASLPHHIRKRIIEEARRKERMKSRANYLPVASNGNLYSQTQLANFLNTSKLNKKFKQAQDKIIGAEDGKRIASEGNKKYSYISTFSLPQTSSLSLGSKSKPNSSFLPGQISSSRLLPNAFQMASQNKTTFKEENEDEFQWLNEVDEEVQEEIQKDNSDIEWEPPSCESEVEEPKDQTDDDYYFTERDWSEKHDENPIINLNDEEDSYYDNYYGEYQAFPTKKKKLIKGKQNPVVSSSNETIENDNDHPLPTTSSSSAQPPPEFTKPLDWAALIAEDSQARSQSENIPGFYSNLHADSEDEDSNLKSNIKTQVIDLIEDSNPKRVRFEDNIAQVETKENFDDDFDDVEWEEGPSQIQPPSILRPDLTFKKVPSLIDFANVDPSPAVSAITQSPPEITTPKEDITGFINSLQDDFLMQEAYKEKQDVYLYPSFDMFSELSKTTEDQDQKTIEEAIATASSMTDWAGRVVKRVLSDHLKKTNQTTNENNNSHSNPLSIVKQEPNSTVLETNSSDRPIHMKSIQQINDEDTFHQPWSDRIPDLQSDSKYQFTFVPQPEDSKDSILANENVNDEIEQLQKQYQNSSRDTERITEDMKEDVLKLIRVFDLPYIIAPFEAEAQCAVLEGMGLVDGVITEDSDVFLFGAKHVYKNIFNDSKFIEVYMMNDVEKELGLTREDLISFAYFLGSDYTEGVNGIGIVNAMEILQAFPMKDRDGGPLHGLERFKQWLLGFDPLQELLKDIREYQNSNSRKQHEDKNKEPQLSNVDMIELPDKEEERIREEEEKLIQFDKKHKHGKMKWTLPDIFPDNRVVKAYLQPPANRERLEFEWPLPMRNLIRDFCRLNLGWTDAQMDLQIDPVLSKWASKGQMQTRIDSHFILNYQDDTRFAKIASKRLRSAIGQIIGSNESHLFQKDQEIKSKKPRKTINQSLVVLGNNSDANLNDNLNSTEETFLPSESIASLVEKQTNRTKTRGRKPKITTNK